MTLQTLIDKSTKRMGTVHSVVLASAIEMIKRAHKEGINVLVTDGYRSMEEQARIYGKGRQSYYYKGKNYGDPDESIVSNAKPGSSNHNYGLAIDFVLCNDDASEVYYEVNAKYKRVAAIGKSLGFAWGGDWKGFKDYPHLEMMGGLTLTDLQRGKRPKLNINFIPELIDDETGKEDEDMKFNPSNESMKQSVARMLLRLSEKENGISKEHREQFLKGEMTVSDAIALLYVAHDRGLIVGK
ncbi:M15 family metallopeptidase [Bacillus sp. JJ722]|uniref:M15 family metallopeptidase n=1 Tax=Bacillus sp. JJ722 TaxID=3122973 RepID=UPI003000EFB8